VGPGHPRAHAHQPCWDRWRPAGGHRTTAEVWTTRPARRGSTGSAADVLVLLPQPGGLLPVCALLSGRLDARPVDAASMSGLPTMKHVSLGWDGQRPGVWPAETISGDHQPAGVTHWLGGPYASRPRSLRGEDPCASRIWGTPKRQQVRSHLRKRPDAPHGRPGAMSGTSAGGATAGRVPVGCG
jgi:hypothetical protein